MRKTLCIGFVGLGLIGGSIARAIHKFYPDYRLIAYTPNPGTTEMAFEEGVIQGICTDVDQSFSSCDYIFLCAPVEYNISYLKKIKEIRKPDCIITDVGSVKTAMHEAVRELGMEDCFIGGHPMTGSEKTGFKNSNDRLLENAYYILTPAGEVNIGMISEYTEFVRSLGAIPMLLSYEEHDYITAAISHLPHVIASTLVNLVHSLDGKEEHMKTIAAGGFKDITRIASSSPVMWEQICTTNAKNISKVLDFYIRSLIQFRVEIDNRNSKELNRLFTESRDYRNSLPDLSSGPIKKVYTIYCDIADKAGGIAAIATLLAANNINLKNIGIVNNREFEEAVLRIEFYEDSAAKKSVSILRANNYIVYER
ncbi:MAG: prephenate dehydrogenase [Lachnospiraceae bacterium]|nr:prephenate dehydrogenase [Lachnospiraceae bacterium]